MMSVFATRADVLCCTADQLRCSLACGALNSPAPVIPRILLKMQEARATLFVRVTFIFAKTEGQWREVAVHVSQLPTAA